MPPTPPADAYADALRLAALVHDGQAWKGTPLPYLTHVVHVAHLLEQQAQPPALVLAGLLHDTIEDVDDDDEEARGRIAALYPDLPDDVPLRAALGTLIDRRFGADVRRLVEAVTAPSHEDEDGPAARVERRKRQLAHLRDAPRDVATLKAADTCANVSALVAVLDATSSVPLDELRWYYGAVADIVAGTLGDADALVVAIRAALAALERRLAGR